MTPAPPPLIERVRASGMGAAVATNGTLLHDGLVEAFRRLGVSRVSVSLDGPTAAVHDEFRGIPGSFDEALAGMDVLARHGQPFQMNTTVTRANMHDLGSMLDLAERVGAAALHLFFLVPVGCGAEIPAGERITPAEYEDLLQWFADERERRSIELRATCAPHLQRILLQRGRGRAAEHEGRHPGGSMTPGKGCLAGTGIVFVGSNGDVQPCGYMPLVVGRVPATDLAQIWNEHEVLQGLRDEGNLTGACGTCAFRKRCGGCRARALALSGDLYGDEPMCSWGKEPADGGERGRTE